MGYYLTIVDENLKSKKDINSELKKLNEENKLYLFWKWGNGYVGLEERYFKWDEEFLKDLLIIKDLEVYGYLTCYGEEGEYYKYEIDDEGVKEYYGSIVFSEKPEKIIKNKDDIKKFF